jgi:glycosyltransferase involved in cell wall biosynthesis
MNSVQPEGIPATSLIIPTMACAERGSALIRAIDSVNAQDGVLPCIIIVVNGGGADPQLIREIRSRPNVTVEILSDANVSAATRLGRSIVRTSTFAFLDDDDILLPNTLRLRLDALVGQSADLLVTNGRRADGTPVCTNAIQINDDPIMALLRENWLASCAGLFRTASITGEFFDGRTKYNEWTLIAFKIAVAGRKIIFVDVPTYEISNTAGSASKAFSEEYFRVSTGVVSHMLEKAPRQYRPALRKKLLSEMHAASDFHRGRGDVKAAWTYHMKSLYSGGWQYLPYTRRLLRF